MQERMQQFEKAMQIFSQMLTSNKIIESIISETIKELQDEQNKQLTAKTEPTLDAYLRTENDEQISGDDEIFFEDEHIGHLFNPNNSSKQRLSLSKS